MKKKYLILIAIIIVVLTAIIITVQNTQNDSEEVSANQEKEYIIEDIDIEQVIERMRIEVRQAKLEWEQHEHELKLKWEEILRKRKALFKEEEKSNKTNSSIASTNNSSDNKNETNNDIVNNTNNNVNSNTNNDTNNSTNKDETIDNTIKISKVTKGNMKQFDYTEKIEDLGIPLIKKYPDNTVAHVSSRNVWDMQLYNNRIYIGSGDYDANTGPVDVYYYDLTKKEFVKEGTLPDEQINRFVVIDDELIITGTDPREGWEYGNYFVWKDNSWIKKRTLLGGIHNFDIVKYKGNLFAGLGNDSDSSIVMSKDGGNTYSYVYMYDENGEKIDVNTNTSAKYRVYDLIEYKDKLYAFCGNRLYEYNEEKNIFVKRNNNYINYGYGYGVGVYVPLKTKLVYDEKIFLINGAIKYTEDLDNYTTVKFDETTYAYDAITIDGELYVLCGTPKNNKYIISVYKTNNSKNWDLVMYFNYDNFARSFEYKDGTFYFGMGTSSFTTVGGENSGRIIEAKLK